MRCRCPWCLGDLRGEPGQVAKCRHCTLKIFWGGDEPFKTEEEALAISLDGLTKITPEVAEALAKCEGGLSLYGLTTITPEVAEALAKHEGHLSLYGLTTITPEALEILRANPDIQLPSKFDEKP